MPKFKNVMSFANEVLSLHAKCLEAGTLIIKKEDPTHKLEQAM